MAMPPTIQLRVAAERAPGPAAQELEHRVQRGDRLALRELEREAAPDEQAAQGDDERRDADVGDDEALQSRRSARPTASPKASAMIQVYGLVEAEPEVLGIHSAWIMAMNMPDEAEHRPDRQVDVAGHDDQDHAGRHDRDGGALDRQVPQVARGEEERRRTAMLNTTQMTAVASDQAEQPRVDLERRERAIGDRRGGSCVTAVVPETASLIVGASLPGWKRRALLRGGTGAGRRVTR